MRANSDDIQRIIRANGGVIARRNHPELVEACNWLVRKGELVPVLPGVYAPRDSAREVGIRMRAAMLWSPDAVLTGPAAAQLSFWPRIASPLVDLATPKKRRGQYRGFRLCERRIAVDLVVTRGGLRYTAPALTALDLISVVGADGIDTALRTRSATLDGMRAALELTPHRPGNSDRRRLLLDSRDEPWSAAERLAHQLLRAAGITGWRANFPVPTIGSVYYVDVAFPAVKLAIEIDGRLHEDDKLVFESDRWRQNHLALLGWTVLRFTWKMLTEHPELVIQTILQALNPFSSCQS